MLFKKEGCNAILSYSDYFNHVNNCKYNNYNLECHIMKYNYHQKKFEKCGYISNKVNMENHFKLCAYANYYCKYCNKIIIHMNLENHVLKDCKFGIINYSNGSTYIGEKQNENENEYSIVYIPLSGKYIG